MTGIIDYGMGNLGSVQKKLNRIGAKSVISSNPAVLEECQKLILPGVGHYGMAVQELQGRGLWDFLQIAALEEKRPILGICLGMQLMAAHSDEGDSKGLSWFDADVVRLEVEDKQRFKIPHMGWNSVTLEKETYLFDNVDTERGFYFVHAYHMVCHQSEDILNMTEYENPFVSAVQKDNIIGVQYHPEKSHGPGERLLRNFLEL
jgi:glutamine amidotransferase